MPTDPALRTFDEIVAKLASTESEIMYEIEPIIIATKDGSSAIAIMAGWFDDHLCVLAIPFFHGRPSDKFFNHATEGTTA